MSLQCFYSVAATNFFKFQIRLHKSYVKHFSDLSQCSPENYWAWKAFVLYIQGQGFSRFVDNMLNKMDWFVASDLLFYCLDFDLNIWFRVQKVTTTFKKWASGSKICIYHTLETHYWRFINALCLLLLTDTWVLYTPAFYRWRKALHCIGPPYKWIHIKSISTSLLKCNYCNWGHLDKFDQSDYKKITIHAK